MGYIGDVKIDYLMFRDLDVGEKFIVTGHESWIFHGRGTMIKTAPSIENDTAKNWNAAYTNNLRDNRTVAYLRTGTEVERVAGPKAAPGTLQIHMVESDASIWDQLDGAGFDKVASGKCFVKHLEAYVCESYPDAAKIEIAYGMVSGVEAYSIEDHSSVRVPEPKIMAHLKELSEQVRYETPWEIEEIEPGEEMYQGEDRVAQVNALHDLAADICFFYWPGTAEEKVKHLLANVEHMPTWFSNHDRDLLISFVDRFFVEGEKCTH